MNLKLIVATAAATVAATIATAAPASAECRQQPVRLELPGQAMGERVDALSRSTGCPIKADPRLIAGKRAPVLVGTVTPDDAIVRSVKGTGLEASPAQGTWYINRTQQDYFAGRVAKSQARIAARQKAGRLSAAQATEYRRDLAALRRGVASNVMDQGFLSAAEQSNYRSTVDVIDQKLR